MFRSGNSLTQPISAFRGGMPSTRIVPDSGTAIPASSFRRVVLPLPFGPITDVIPGAMWRFSMASVRYRSFVKDYHGNRSAIRYAAPAFIASPVMKGRAPAYECGKKFPVKGEHQPADTACVNHERGKNKPADADRPRRSVRMQGR